MKKITLKLKQLFAVVLMLSCIPANAQMKATLEQYAQSGYATVIAEFKLTEIATALETDTATLVAALDAWYDYDEESGAEQPADMFFLKVGDELSSDYTQGSPGGFWINRDGTVGSWGAGAVYYDYIWWDNEENADYFAIELGQFPDSLAAGATLNPTFVLQHGEKQATFDITYTVKPLPTMPEPELEIAKLEIVGNAEVTVEQYPASNWSPDVVSVNLKGVAEKLGVETAIFPTMFPGQLYQAYVEPTYGYKVDSLVAITVNDGWGQVVMDKVEGDTLSEVCSVNWGNLSTDLKAYYTNGWSYDAETDTLSCNLGQYPGRMEAGDQLYSYVYIVYGSKAYVIKYNVNVVENPNSGGNIDEMTCVGTSVIRIEQEVYSSYETSSFSLNVDSIANLLGCTASDMTYQAIDNKGALSTSSTANNGGYWMTQGGIICSWGDNAYMFVEPASSNDYSKLNVGQMPGNTAVGEEGTAKLYLTFENKYYEIDFTLAIVEGKYVEQNFESVATRNYTIQQLLDTDYAWSEQTATIPYAQIYELIGTSDPVLYALNIDSVAAKSGAVYTKDYSCTPHPGFWLNKESRRSAWGDANLLWGISGGYVSDSENYVINCIQLPGATATGDVYTGQFFLVNEETGKMITINLTYQIVETLVELEVVGDEYINLPVSIDDIEIEYDLTKVATALGLESVNALLFDGYYLKGLKADGTYTSGVDAVGGGVTLGTNGAADEYGSIGIYFSEDGTKICTYSNEDITAPFKAEGEIAFQVDNKIYKIHVTLYDTESYATGIESIVLDSNKSGKIYNLQGQEVVNPAKGIYIKNGKKFIVK